MRTAACGRWVIAVTAVHQTPAYVLPPCGDASICAALVAGIKEVINSGRRHAVVVVSSSSSSGVSIGVVVGGGDHILDGHGRADFMDTAW